VFFALWPDAQTLSALHACAQRIHLQCGGRLMRRDSLHLTLAFLGELPASRIDVLLALAADLRGKPFELVLSRAGSWQKNRVVWGAPERTPPALAALADGLAAGLRTGGFRVEARPFSAHVTLVRNAREAPPPDIPAPVRWRVDNFALIRSRLGPEGARYEVIGDWPLAGAPDDQGGPAATLPWPTWT
jgi:2'-5' RNA ligase